MHCFDVEHFIFLSLSPDCKVLVLNLHTVELVPNKVVYVIFFGIIALKTGLVRVELTPRKKGHRKCQMILRAIINLILFGLKVIRESSVVNSHILVNQILRALAQPFINFLVRLAPLSVGGRILAVN
jgi:hypothetical protein